MLRLASLAQGLRLSANEPVLACVGFPYARFLRRALRPQPGRCDLRGSPIGFEFGGGRVKWSGRANTTHTSDPCGGRFRRPSRDASSARVPDDSECPEESEDNQSHSNDLIEAMDALTPQEPRTSGQ